jgi:hypothetical protein
MVLVFSLLLQVQVAKMLHSEECSVEKMKLSEGKLQW